MPFVCSFTQPMQTPTQCPVHVSSTGHWEGVGAVKVHTWGAMGMWKNREGSAMVARGVKWMGDVKMEVEQTEEEWSEPAKEPPMIWSGLIGFSNILNRTTDGRFLHRGAQCTCTANFISEEQHVEINVGGSLVINLMSQQGPFKSHLVLTYCLTHFLFYCVGTTKGHRSCNQFP